MWSKRASLPQARACIQWLAEEQEAEPSPRAGIISIWQIDIIAVSEVKSTMHIMIGSSSDNVGWSSGGMRDLTPYARGEVDG